MNNLLKFTAIIPARYQSTRFPGKPLALIGDKTMIERVYRQVSKAVDNIWVATDDNRIADAVKAFGGRVVMTSSHHQSGTDRLREAAEKIAADSDVIINVQGDEPFIDPSQIDAVVKCFDDPETRIATLARRFDPSAGIDALVDPNLIKIVFDKSMNAIYFSRSVIPFIRGEQKENWLDKFVFHTHVGLYAYRRSTLLEITDMERSPLEIAESLEQLRWIENGLKIKVAITDKPTIGIDTPADLAAAISFARKIEGV